jgi:hypothetical protein
MTHDILEGKKNSGRGGKWEQKKNWEQEKIGSKKRNLGAKKQFWEQIKVLGARRQHMAKGVGLFFTLSFCSSEKEEEVLSKACLISPTRSSQKG